MQQFLKNLTALGPARLAALGITGVALLALLFFGMRFASAPTFVTLYGGLSPAEAGRVVDSLEAAGFQVEISGGGAIVSVPQDDVPRARMALAEEGLPEEGAPGWELFDNASGMGMNSFMQQVSRLRALEGELGRSIRTIQGVEAARVHLVLPDREAFSRVRPEPSASVIVQTKMGNDMSRRQASAIRALVASAVPGLLQNRVTILSATGETILAEEDPGTETIDSMSASVEERLQQNITDILAARVGAGNVRLSVKVDLETERRVLRSKSFDPDQQVVRSTETREENNEDNQGQSPVDTGANLPDPLATGDTGQTVSSNRSARTDTVINYEIGSTEEETVREPGDIRRVSVAVLVNGIYTLDANGERVYAERSPEELKLLNELVRSAVGFDDARGDAVSVESLQFADYASSIEAPADPTLQELLMQNIDSILRGLFAMAVVALVLILGVRPALKALLPERPRSATNTVTTILQTVAAPGTASQAETQPVTANPAAALAAYQAPTTSSTAFPTTVGRRADDDSLVSLDSVDGTLRKGWLNSLSALVDRDKDDAMRVIQTWLAEEE